MIDRRSVVIAALVLAPVWSIAKAPVRKPVTLTYLSNAGWQIEDGHTVIIIDPYVSQSHDKRMGNPNTSDDSDEVLVPDGAQVAAHIPRADFVIVTHSHSNRCWGHLTHMEQQQRDDLLDQSMHKALKAILASAERDANIELSGEPGGS
jgi:hypothetical protein